MLNGVMNEVASWLDYFILIWWYPEYASRKHRVFAPCGRVDHLIDAWQWVGHLGTSLVHARVIHAPRPVLLPHKNGVCYPLKVEHLLDESGSHEPSNLLADRLPLLIVEMPQALLDRSSVWQDVQRVLNNLPRDPRHVQGLPHKDALVVAQEVGERAFLFVNQAGPNPDHLVGILGIDLDRRGVLGGLEGARGGFPLCQVGCHLRSGELVALELE
jgi:hypothetical protein